MAKKMDFEKQLVDLWENYLLATMPNGNTFQGFMDWVKLKVNEEE